MADLKPGVNPQVFAAFYGMRIQRPMVSLDNGFIFDAPSVAAAAAIARALESDSAVEWSFQDEVANAVPLDFVPNDPLYSYTILSTHAGQWHLRNTGNVGGAEIDARVWGAWQRDATGSGILVGIVDDGLDRTHPDILPNYSSANSYDFRDLDGDPSPGSASDRHGTAVAGIAGARGGNGIGVTGAAPYATLAGLRIGYGANGSTAMYADATLYRANYLGHPYKIKNHSYGWDSAWADPKALYDAITVSGDYGVIHVFAAGNFRNASAGDSAKSTQHSNRHTLTVAALAANGKASHYSNYGAPVIVTAPSSGHRSDTATIGTMTTDLQDDPGYNGLAGNNDYTPDFGGTSSAAPLVAGILAQVKQILPSLNSRFAKHLLARNSDMVDPDDNTPTSDGGWRTNAGGFRFNQNYGFGAINAERLVRDAHRYEGLTPRDLFSTVLVPKNEPIGIYDKLSHTFTVSGREHKVEEVRVVLNLTHDHMGHLQAFVTSPSGTRVRMLRTAPASSTDFTGKSWPILTNNFWGENPNGTWKVELENPYGSGSGTWNSVALSIGMGDVILKPSFASEFVSQSVQTSYYARQTATVNVKMKNVGSSQWVAGKFYLVSQNPYANDTWGRVKVDLSQNEVVEPGETKTFTFTIKTPSEAGTYNFQWQMRNATGPVSYNFGDRSTNVPVEILTGDHATFYSQSVANIMPIGSRNIVQVIMRNAGSTDWKYGETYLVSQSPYANDTWGRIKADLNPGETVLPGGYKTFNFVVVAPWTPGEYPMQWQMRRGGVANFGQMTSLKNVKVELWNNSDFTGQNVPTQVSPGEVFSVTLNFTNTGTSTWDPEAFFLVSESPLGNKTWGKDRISLGSPVSAGGAKRFTFNLVAPQKEGEYNFQWQMRSVSPTRANFGEKSTLLKIQVGK